MTQLRLEDMNKSIGDLHIDDFCKDTARVLLLLYKKFPVKTTLYVEDISGPDDPDEFGLHSPRFEACFSAVVWLREADYIYYSSTVRQEAVEEAVLSHRGFCFMSAMENDAQETLVRRVDQINHALGCNSEYLKELILRYMVTSRDYN